MKFLPLPVPRHDPKQPEAEFRERLFACKDRSPLVQTSGSIMTAKPVCIRPEALLVDAIQTMIQQDIGALPVVDGNSGEICGIFTTTDVLRVFRVMMQIGSIVEPNQPQQG